MCGLAGYIEFNGPGSKEITEKMIKTLSHRGPDNQTVKVLSSSSASVCLGHARLSIIDLSEEANQPFVRKSNVLIFNGEVYNYQEIRNLLENKGYHFTTQSDTEVILASFEEWGIKCVERFRGMFAFVLLDLKEQKVFFCRDRAGVKPFFYYLSEKEIIFGSELKALVAHPSFRKEVDPISIHQFMDYGYVPGPRSIFQNTSKLEPGSIIEIDLISKNLQRSSYWSLKEFYEKPSLKLSYEEAKTETKSLLKEASEYRMVADVPVGVFLSGGYDSSCVAALLQKDKTEKLKTYTIAFPDGQNEAPFAEEVAGFLVTDHTTFDCTYQEAKDVIPEMPYFFDEPNADISCIPTFLVSKMARKEVKVALSADGGDEAFMGYKGYKKTIDLIAKLNKLGFLASPLGNVFSFINSLNIIQDQRVSNKLDFFSRTLKSKKRDRLAVYLSGNLLYPYSLSSGLIKNFERHVNPVFDINYSELNENRNLPMLIDFESTMRDLLLVKVDRASMANSLEAREPLLDHKLFEFAAQLPFDYKYSGKLKRILKDIVHDIVPKELMDRPKMGFDLPLYEWLKTDLSYLIEDYLSPEKISKYEIFNSDEVQILLKRFRTNKLSYKTIIWRMIVLQMWYERWGIEN